MKPKKTIRETLRKKYGFKGRKNTNERKYDASNINSPHTALPIRKS
jgi:hypothetical protein